MELGVSQIEFGIGLLPVDVEIEVIVEKYHFTNYYNLNNNSAHSQSPQKYLLLRQITVFYHSKRDCRLFAQWHFQNPEDRDKIIQKSVIYLNGASPVCSVGQRSFHLRAGQDFIFYVFVDSTCHQNYLILYSKPSSKYLRQSKDKRQTPSCKLHAIQPLIYALLYQLQPLVFLPFQNTYDQVSPRLAGPREFPKKPLPNDIPFAC